MRCYNRKGKSQNKNKAGTQLDEKQGGGKRNSLFLMLDMISINVWAYDNKKVKGLGMHSLNRSCYAMLAVGGTTGDITWTLFICYNKLCSNATHKIISLTRYYINLGILK